MSADESTVVVIGRNEINKEANAEKKRGPMEQTDKSQPVTLQELLVATVAQADVIAKLLIEKGIITREEYIDKLSAQRAVYQKLLDPTVE